MTRPSPAAGENLPRVEQESAMPKVLKELISELNEWSERNRLDARRDAQLFWILKIVGALAAGSAGLLGYLKWEVVGLVVGLAGGVIVMIDAKYPSALLRSVHTLASRELARLSNEVLTKWRLLALRKEDQSEVLNDELVAIVEYVEQEKKRIAAFISSKESWLPEKG